MDIKQAQRILLIDFLAMVSLTLLTVAGYETDLLPLMDATGKGTEIFVWQVGMEIMSIIVIPVALKMFRLKPVRRQLERTKGSALVLWGVIRIELLCVPMWVNTFMYYQTMSPAFGYLAIILFLCLFFVYPSIDRCLVEIDGRQTGLHKETENQDENKDETVLWKEDSKA